MKTTLAVLAGLTGSLALSSGAMGAIASTQAVVQEITSAGAAAAGLQTWAVFIAFEGTGDVLLSHTQWNVGIEGGTFFNANPVSDDPLGAISDTTGGHIPIAPFVLGLPGYEQWAWDTNLSMDNSSDSVVSAIEPVMDLTDTYVGGFGAGGGGAGVFNSNPVNPVTAGADLLIQVAQLTFSAGTPIVSGQFVALTPAAAAGATNTTISVFIPAPGAIALLGMAGLVGTRRRRA